MGEIRRFASGGPWEVDFGYSRVVAAGPFVFVAGCAAMEDGSLVSEGDPYGQTLAAFGVVERALAEAGCSLADVVQTRLFLTHISDQREVGRAHAELFAAGPPVTTMLQVAALVHPRMLVEVEAIAYRPMPAPEVSPAAPSSAPSSAASPAGPDVSA